MEVKEALTLMIFGTLIIALNQSKKNRPLPGQRLAVYFCT
ncbi:putative holin-like toxin [Paenibacillus sp. BJ-4]|nr:putative holin-like toxin [Paenibacillus sp. BJ-4]